MIKLIRNEGFRWIEKDEYYFKGYFYYKNKFYYDNEAVNCLYKIKSFEILKKFLKEITGCFAIVIQNNNEIWCANDVSRSIPIFYSEENFIVSDCVEQIKKRISCKIDDVSLGEILLSHGCSSGHTIYNNINQVKLGEVVKISKHKVVSEYYFQHIKKTIFNERTNELFKFTTISENIFDRLMNSLDGKKVVVPLSGGYDSRYIISMLKKKKCKDVICYTYGNENDYEVQYSKKIAENLGYDWYFVEYSNEKWEKFFEEKSFLDYFHYSHNYCSLPHIQEYIALKELKERNIIPQNSVIIPGFCGDFPAGSFVIKENEFNIKDLNELVEFIFGNHFNNTKCNQEIEKKIKERIMKRLIDISLENNINKYDYEDLIKLYECWFCGDRVTNWVVNSNRLYEFFGFEWRMPLWDIEFLNFWYELQLDYRINCNLYIEWLFENLFVPMNINFLKPKSILRKENILKRKVKFILKKIIIYFSFKFKIDMYKRNNINNYNIVALNFYNLLGNKKIFSFNFNSVHQIKAIWWAEYKYGSENIKRIVKNRNLNR